MRSDATLPNAKWPHGRSNLQLRSEDRSSAFPRVYRLVWVMCVRCAPPSLYFNDLTDITRDDDAQIDGCVLVRRPAPPHGSLEIKHTRKSCARVGARKEHRVHSENPNTTETCLSRLFC